MLIFKVTCWYWFERAEQTETNFSKNPTESTVVNEVVLEN